MAKARPTWSDPIKEPLRVVKVESTSPVLQLVEDATGSLFIEGRRKVGDRLDPFFVRVAGPGWRDMEVRPDPQRDAQIAAFDRGMRKLVQKFGGPPEIGLAHVREEARGLLHGDELKEFDHFCQLYDEAAERLEKGELDLGAW